MFHIPNDPVIELSSSLSMVKGHFISFFKATKLVLKGCIYNLVRVNDSSADLRSLQSAPLVKDFQ